MESNLGEDLTVTPFCRTKSGFNKHEKGSNGRGPAGLGSETLVTPPDGETYSNTLLRRKDRSGSNSIGIPP